MRQLKICFLSVVVVCMGFACASSNGVNSQTGTQTAGQISPETEELARFRGEHVVTSIVFEQGSSDLSPLARAEIDRAVSIARDMGLIYNVTVAVWSDQEYPGSQVKLPKSQINLARERGESIEDYFETKNIGPIAVHNMARRPNAMARLFRTADAQLKSQLVEHGIAPTVVQDSIVRGKSSSAIIMMRVDARY